MQAATVILADGDFPVQPQPLAALRRARRIVCCDGAARKLRDFGLEPAAVVGDMDSLPATIRRAYGSRVVRDAGQDDNDLSKAFRYCLQQGWRNLVVLGATGLREDHTLGNISLLADFAREARVIMLTDTGEFRPLLKSSRLPCKPGQGVSIFSFDPATAITSRGLKYPLRRLRLSRWWQAALNEAEGRSFDLQFTGGPLLVYSLYTRRTAATRRS